MALSFNFKNVSVHTTYLLVRLNQNFTAGVSDEAESLTHPSTLLNAYYTHLPHG